MKKVMNLIAKHRLLALLITALWATGMHAQRTFKAMINGQETNMKCVQLWEHGPYFAEMNIGASSPTDLGIDYRYTGPWYDPDNGISHIEGTEFDPATKNWGGGWQVPTKNHISQIQLHCDITASNENEGNLMRPMGYLTIRGRGEYSDRVLYVPYRIQWVEERDEDGNSKGIYPIFYGHYCGNLVYSEPRIETWGITYDKQYITLPGTEHTSIGELRVRAIVRVDLTELNQSIETAEQLLKDLNNSKLYGEENQNLSDALEQAQSVVKNSKRDCPDCVEEALENLKNAIKAAQNLINGDTGDTPDPKDDNPGSTEPTDSIGGGGGDIIIPGDSIGGGDEPSSTDGILWYEPFTDYAANDVPTGGKYNYVSTNGSSTTKVYNENLAGGEAPELLVSKNGGSFTATVPLNSAKGPFTLSYQANRNISVVVEGGRLGEVTKNDKNYTYTIETDTTSRGTLVIAFQNSTSSNVRLDDIKLTGIIPESGDIIIPSDSIDGGGGDIIIPGDNPDHPTSVNSEAYRKMYLDYLNYYYDHVRNHHIATWLYNYVERECDRLDDHFENQEACDNLYAYLLEKFNIIREMVGDTPYNGTSYKPQNFNTEKLDALAIHAEAYYDKIHVSHTGPAYNLSDALRDALLATYEIKTQADIERIYNKLLEEYNDVRRRCGDGPYGEDDEEADSDNPDYANLNSAIRRSGWFIEDLEADSKYAGIMAELQNALDEAKKALSSKKQSVIDAAAQALEDALLKAQNDKKEMDKQPEIADEEGTPIPPIAPDLAQYTHKMMVHGSPWGINGLNMIMMRDKHGRLVQTMTVQARNGGEKEIITDSVRTYVYTNTKMIENLSVPEYDSNDNLTLVPMSHKETSYYRLADGGHREVCIDMREDGGKLTPIHKEVTTYDKLGRKVSYKNYSMWNGEELEYYYDYSYDEDGGFYTKGKNDWGENVHTYTCYDQNGNQTYKTDYNGLYIYEWDKQNHAQGYTFYRNYNVEDNTCTSVDESRLYKITETYDDGRTKTMRTANGSTKTYVYADNQETETVNDNGTTTTYVRTFDVDGRLLKMEKNGTALISEFAWSNIDADKVLGGVSKVDENMNWQISKGTTYWTSDKALLSARRSFIFEGFKEDETSTYNIVPVSVQPAETTEKGIAIPVGGEGDLVSMDADGEIYLMDKGGKKRFCCKAADNGMTVEDGKIIICGWTAVDGGSSSVRRKAPSKLDLEDGEYSVYIPENVVKVNDEPMQEMFAAITMEQEDLPDSMAGIKTAADAAVYNLQGMKVENPTQGQITIIKGKKVLVK